jgi:glucose/arabinose dehydrogenase
MRASPAIAIALLVASVAVADLHAQLRLRPHASGFTSPIAFVQDPADRAVQFVVQQNGRVRVIRDGTVLGPDFIDLSSAIVAGGEQGLLGFAFSPDTLTSGRFFVNFTNRSGDTVVARLRRSGNAVVADPATRFDLRWGGAAGQTFIAQPFANHNGGHLAFGPDGFLYIGLGDGGSGDDPDHRAQNPNELLGKMLRIDVSVADTHPIGYQVPATNPFVGGSPITARPEIWAFGLRNPWRYSFDDPARGGTGALVIGDVGQNQFEEVDYEPAARGGRNYGWRNREGLHGNVSSRPPAYLPLVDPIHYRGVRVSRQRAAGAVSRSILLCRFRCGTHLLARPGG